MMKKSKAIPRLRFKQFDTDWVATTIAYLANKVGSGSTPRGGEKVYVGSGIPFIRSQNVIDDRLNLDDATFITAEINNQMRSTIVNPGDILLNITGASIGRSCVVPDDFRVGNVNQHVCIIRLNENNNPVFLQAFLSSNKGQQTIRKLQVGSGREGLNFSSVKVIGLFTTSLKEQQRIAEFLSSVDEKIAQLTKKKALLEEYKKGVMQGIFSRKIRFKDEKGKEYPEWERIALNNLLDVSRQKNFELTFGRDDVLSVSGEHGIMNQIELLGRSYAGESVANYSIVKTDDIVYTKSPLKENPFGIIKVNKGRAGIVSTLYAVYNCKAEKVVPELIDYYFQSDVLLNNYLKPIVNKGSKNDMKVNNEHVLTGFVTLPSSLKEQRRIVALLESIDEKIGQTQKQLEQTKEFKKGLLQQMFV